MRENNFFKSFSSLTFQNQPYSANSNTFPNIWSNLYVEIYFAFMFVVICLNV